MHICILQYFEKSKTPFQNLMAYIRVQLGSEVHLTRAGVNKADILVNGQASPRAATSERQYEGGLTGLPSSQYEGGSSPLRDHVGRTQASVSMRGAPLLSV
jgi:hypothetical protein